MRIKKPSPSGIDENTISHPTLELDPTKNDELRGNLWRRLTSSIEKQM